MVIDKRINILHIIESSATGGAETIFLDIVKYIDPACFEMHNCLFYNGWLFQQLVANDKEVINLDSKGAFDLKLLIKLLVLIRKKNIHLIHAHLFGAGVYGSLAGLLSRKPVIVTLHGEIDIDPNDNLKKVKLFILNQSVDRIVFVSNSLMKTCNNVGLGNSKTSTVIYNGIDLHYFKPAEGNNSKWVFDIKKNLSLDADSFLVGAIGDIHPVKGYTNLIEAAAKIKKECCNAKFIIAGRKTRYYSELKNTTIAAGLENDLFFIGHIANIPDLLGQIDLFLSSSVTEGFSLSTIEAMAMKKPSIVTRSGGPEEIVDDLVNGILVTPNSPDELAQAVITLINNNNISSKIASNARDKIVKIFSVTKMLESYQDLYRTLIEG